MFFMVTFNSVRIIILTVRIIIKYDNTQETFSFLSGLNSVHRRENTCVCVCVNSICATTSSKVTDWTKWVKTNTKKRKKRKGELFCLPICLSICARRRVKSSNLDFTWLGGLRSAVGWRMFVSSGSRRAVWSLKSVRSSIKKKTAHCGVLEASAHRQQQSVGE